MVVPGLIGQDDFHGAKYYRDLAGQDVSKEFLDLLTAQFPAVAGEVDTQLAERPDTGPPSWAGLRQARELAAGYGLQDVYLVKARVSETVRMLLHRVPWRVVVRPGSREEDLDAVLLLAAHRGVPVDERSDLHDVSVGLMRPPTPAWIPAR